MRAFGRRSANKNHVVADHPGTAGSPAWPSLRLGMTPFAVIDVETTGFSPRLHDRVVELAVLRLSPDGAVEDEYATLLNPGRDLGATHVHGLTAADVRDAPTFPEVVGDVATRLDGAVLVGHNVRFDVGFLAAECGRAGFPLPPMPALCTLRLAYLLAPRLASRKLTDCCSNAGITMGMAHSALGDDRATAQLLAFYLNAGRAAGLHGLAAFGCQPLTLPDAPWCRVAPSGRCLHRDQAARARRERATYLARLVDRLDPVAAGGAEVAAYLDLLDRALEDRRITEAEAGALLATAQEWGLSRDQVTTAHQQYLRALVTAARADEVVSPAERHDLASVCALLGLPPTMLEAQLADRTPPPGGVTAPREAGTTAKDLAGGTVCFTGSLSGRLDGEPVTRARAEQLATAAGLVVAPGVTKGLDLLVVADPDSLSAKARKARQYGTRIMAEAVFWQAIGVAVE
jgi:DNA polymerase III subunit epsilon